MKNHFFIFSGYRSENTDEENKRNHRAIKNYLDELGIPYTEVEGSYQGVVEQSFLIDMQYGTFAFLFAQHFKQESVFEVVDGEAFLYYSDGTREKLPGKWAEITPTRAKGLEAWTRVGGTFFSVL